MISLNAANILAEEGYTHREIHENMGLFEELLELLAGARLPDPVLANVTYVTTATVRDGVTRVEVLKWLLAFSERIGAIPIKYLTGNLPGTAVDDIVIAANLHFEDVVRKPQEPLLPPLDITDVIPLDPVRSRQWHKR